MKSFKEWAEEQSAGLQSKPWSASKEEIISHWNGLPPSIPFTGLRSIPPHHKGSTYSYDGIRITGSANFIDCIISRLKDFLRYEGQDTLLQVVYKQQEDNKTKMPRPQSYVFYLQTKARGGDPNAIRIQK